MTSRSLRSPWTPQTNQQNRNPKALQWLRLSLPTDRLKHLSSFYKHSMTHRPGHAVRALPGGDATGYLQRLQIYHGTRAQHANSDKSARAIGNDKNHNRLAAKSEKLDHFTEEYIEQ